MECNDGEEQSERRKIDIPDVPDTGEPDGGGIYIRRTVKSRLKAVAWGLRAPGPLPLILRLFRAASNHHESPFRIGAEPRGTTNARGDFSRAGAGDFFFWVGNLIGRYRAGAHYTVLTDPRREFISAERIISTLPQGLSATDRFTAG